MSVKKAAKAFAAAAFCSAVNSISKSTPTVSLPAPMVSTSSRLRLVYHGAGLQSCGIYRVIICLGKRLGETMKSRWIMNTVPSCRTAIVALAALACTLAWGARAQQADPAIQIGERDL